MPPRNGKNGNNSGISLPTVVAFAAMAVTLMMGLGGFASFRDQLSIREHEQYKALVVSEREGMRRRIDRLELLVLRIEEEQKRRTGTIQSLQAHEKQLDRFNSRVQELERQFGSTYTLNDEIKRLNVELQSLRSRILVPATQR